jgi:glycerol-3-phosphate O-acyltransferase
MCPVALNGEVLHVRQGDMLDESVSKDLVLLTAGPVVSCAEFRSKARSDAEERALKSGGEVEDKKQAVADALMATLEELHTEGEKKRQGLLAKTSVLKEQP